MIENIVLDYLIIRIPRSFFLNNWEIIKTLLSKGEDLVLSTKSNGSSELVVTNPFDDFSFRTQQQRTWKIPIVEINKHKSIARVDVQVDFYKQIEINPYNEQLNLNGRKMVV